MTASPNTPADPAGWAAWRPALLHALPATALVLCLFHHWFAVADRYIVFLYHHDMGPLVPDTSPFSIVTSSRYWMAGLVAGGAVMVLYASANWLAGRLVGRHRPPAWWRVWALSAGPLLIGIPAITMTANHPTLPASNAAQTTLVALVGLALGLVPGRLAAERPVDLMLLAADGWGLALVLLDAIALERVSRWLARGAVWYVWGMVVSLVAGVGWLLVITGVRVGLRIWRRRSIPGARALFTAGLCVAYPLLAAVHHVCYTDGYYYITDRDNFFARSGALQALTWLAAAALAVGVTQLRERLAAGRMAARGDSL